MPTPPPDPDSRPESRADAAASVAAGARARCADCGLPLRTCLCALVRPVAHRCAIKVLQHPAEALQAKGTLRLLQRCLRDCQVAVGTQWQTPPWPLADCWLLYPGGDAQGPPPAQLLLLDGSWRQSRQLMHLNPWLQALPRYALSSAGQLLWRAAPRACAAAAVHAGGSGAGAARAGGQCLGRANAARRDAGLAESCRPRSAGRAELRAGARRPRRRRAACQSALAAWSPSSPW